ncbi:Kelch repeat-containing protein [Pseudomonas mucidolens]|uniref:Kelch repeat-containing protein n=1 Tax=Pseudomonas mucidolens TaxID=46679 RepID=UPI0009FBABC3|nr:kelch repeat-containing protein [Pseudomonas mucidolens]
MMTTNPGEFIAVNAMHQPRAFHSSVAMTHGRLLVIGGSDATVRQDYRLYDAFHEQIVPRTWQSWLPSRGAKTGVEQFDQRTGLWRQLASLPEPRSACGAALLASGQVLAVGGSGNGHSYGSALLYDPTIDQWTSIDEMTFPRFSHSTTLLASGEVLVAGGNNLQSNGGQVQDSAERYDPATGKWRLATTLPTDCMDHTATLLATGQVLVVGGYSGPTGAALTQVCMYDPASDHWRAVSPLPQPRMQHTATLLEDGRVLIAGGSVEPFGIAQAAGFIYDAGADTWASTQMNLPRKGHSATRLLSGEVLLVGDSSMGNPGSGRSAEVFISSANQWLLTGELNDGSYGHSAACLTDGRVLIVGGYRLTAHPAPLSRVEQYQSGPPPTGVTTP